MLNFLSDDNFIAVNIHSTDWHLTSLRRTMEFSSRKKHIEMSFFQMPLCYVTGKCKIGFILIFMYISVLGCCLGYVTMLCLCLSCLSLLGWSTFVYV